ncbi:hypothetical protein DP939_40405 [Spongiactinospora rosea]|uniref:Uncharacterized protein n=1 Tax=Spongiactinospora rosea TaxID=2248750 RepID=A0A366LKR7_9ACTN|nr:hypothetical protein [Spongiactinospora rosea]RBQ14526.1 hypothetical protein DP939_40405 [Spongiactinospora rosea]
MVLLLVAAVVSLRLLGWFLTRGGVRTAEEIEREHRKMLRVDEERHPDQDDPDNYWKRGD